MTAQDTPAVIETFLAAYATRDAAALTAATSAGATIEVAGDPRLPWVGTCIGPEGLIDMLAEVDAHTTAIEVGVEGTLCHGSRGVVVGHSRIRLHATGATFDTDFALVVDVEDGRVARLRILEDSWGLSRAAG